MKDKTYLFKIFPSQTSYEQNSLLSIGIPLKKNLIFDKNKIQISDEKQNVYPCEIIPLCYWNNKSIKWSLLNICLPPLSSPTTLFLNLLDKERNKDKFSGLQVDVDKDIIKIHTREREFILHRHSPCIFKDLELDLEFIKSNGEIKRFRDVKNKTFRVLSKGKIKTDIEIKGQLIFSKNEVLNIRFIISFFYHSNTIKMEVEVHNPNSCNHAGGKWDLGDKGAIYFKDFSLLYKFKTVPCQIKYTQDIKKSFDLISRDIDGLKIYQDSSGGENWDSPNHIDHSGNLCVKFKGFYIKEIKQDKIINKSQGARANPLVMARGESWICVYVKDFWENFPKAIEVSNQYIRISLFPKESKTFFELQGGEKKTHTIFVDFDSEDKAGDILGLIFPPLFKINPEWIRESSALPYFLPESEDQNKTYLSYIKNIIHGPNSFFKKREQIDEYGWRNFGDLYADHEAVHHKGEKPFISHYNNQYDFLYGAIINFLRSGESKWFDLAEPLARHLIDIDIYHTDKDKSAYNHGMFWHTDHYLEAKTATHRTYSKLNKTTGGGPSNEHNYTTGLLHYYFLTGDILAKEAVIELAQWVINMDRGDKTLYAIFDQGPTGLASQTVDPMYHRPGRGAGNSINALIDAYVLTNQRRFLFKAEEIIRRTIHPKDNIKKLGLDNPEFRWSYLVFLQILDKYISLKLELDEKDWMCFYAIESLIHYGRWMLENEVPYMDVLDRVEIPTETWPAQDIRKAYVLNCVSKYLENNEKELFLKKARFFFDRCIQDLLSFETAYLTRPMVLLSTYGSQQAYFDKKMYNNFIFVLKHNYSFARPSRFVPQKYRWKQTFKKNLKIFTRELLRIIKDKTKAIF